MGQLITVYAFLLPAWNSDTILYPGCPIRNQNHFLKKIDFIFNIVIRALVPFYILSVYIGVETRVMGNTSTCANFLALRTRRPPVFVGLLVSLVRWHCLPRTPPVGVAAPPPPPLSSDWSPAAHEPPRGTLGASNIWRLSAQPTAAGQMSKFWGFSILQP